jgi:hypothetical protein
MRYGIFSQHKHEISVEIGFGVEYLCINNLEVRFEWETRNVEFFQIKKGNST